MEMGFMRKRKRDVPVYVITGILESGKTSFINDTLRQDYFQIPQKTIVVNCESGEEEYDAVSLMKFKTSVCEVDGKEAFTEAYLQELEDAYLPGRVVIEYNPLWGVKQLLEMKLPEGWEIIQQIVTIDASTFQVYRNNMRPVFGDMSQKADLVMFNRCTEDMPLADFRRSVKVLNGGCDVAFEGADRKMINLFEDSVPYDLSADVIEIEDIDYGIFYVDARDNPDRYKGKTVKVKGRVMKNPKMASKEFVLGRMAMTCCADDTQFIGYLCVGPEGANYKNGSYAVVTAEIEYKFRKEYRCKGPVFYIKKMEPAPEIENDMVYFN